MPTSRHPSAKRSKPAHGDQPRKKLGPLGLLPDLRIDSAVISKLEIAEGFDISREKTKLLASGLIVPDAVDLVEREFKRFFVLNLVFKDPRYPFVPCEKVDFIWHELIISTRRYWDLCETVYGHYVHHDPEDPRSEYIAKYAGEIYGYTLECLASAFGGIPPKIWGYGAAGNAAVCPRCNFQACKIS